MKIGIVSFGENLKIKDLTEALQRTLKDQGHTIFLYDGNKDIKESFAPLKHLIFVVDSGSVTRKSSSGRLQQFLRFKGDLRVDYASLFITDKLFPGRSFLKMMKLLEAQGLILVNTDIIKNSTMICEVAASLCFD